nr:unnamed protein product [Timema bartmani]
MGDTSSVKQPVSGGSASVGNMRGIEPLSSRVLVDNVDWKTYLTFNMTPLLLSEKSCKAIRFHLLVVVMVLLSRFLIIVEAPVAE